MAVTGFPSVSPSPSATPDLTLLNVSRLVTRLEHNLLSPGAEVRSLRRDGFQRMRVSKNLEYALTLLNNLERSLPQLKTPDRKHAAQTEIARDRALLKRMQVVLDEAEENRTLHAHDEDEEDNDHDNLDDEAEEGEEGEWADVFSVPLTTERVVSSSGQEQQRKHIAAGQKGMGYKDGDTDRATSMPITAATASATATTSTPSSQPTTTTTSSTLRSRHQTASTPKPTTTNLAPNSTSEEPSKLAKTEQTLTTQRLEQEDLTSSLLSLATQLKTSSQSFQTTLASEKSVLDRAVSGIDRTTATMEAAGKRMGMLRRMTEGKGWWGRMILYAWILGLWVLAVLIVFVGPKLRF